MRPPIAIVHFTAGRGSDAAQFRLVIGRSSVEVSSTDGLGDRIWVDCGQRAPLSVSDIQLQAINLLLEYIGTAALDPDKRPGPIHTGRALSFGARGLEINLGRVDSR